MNGFVFVGCQTEHSFHLVETLGCASQKNVMHQELGAETFCPREGEKETYLFLQITNTNPEYPNI